MVKTSKFGIKVKWKRLEVCLFDLYIKKLKKKPVLFFFKLELGSQFRFCCVPGIPKLGYIQAHYFCWWFLFLFFLLHFPGAVLCWCARESELEEAMCHRQEQTHCNTEISLFPLVDLEEGLPKSKEIEFLVINTLKKVNCSNLDAVLPPKIRSCLGKKVWTGRMSRGMLIYVS